MSINLFELLEQRPLSEQNRAAIVKWLLTVSQTTARNYPQHNGYPHADLVQDAVIHCLKVLHSVRPVIITSAPQLNAPYSSLTEQQQLTGDKRVKTYLRRSIKHAIIDSGRKQSRHVSAPFDEQRWPHSAPPHAQRIDAKDTLAQLHAIAQRHQLFIKHPPGDTIVELLIKLALNQISYHDLWRAEAIRSEQPINEAIRSRVYRRLSRARSRLYQAINSDHQNGLLSDGQHELMSTIHPLFYQNRS